MISRWGVELPLVSTTHVVWRMACHPKCWCYAVVCHVVVKLVMADLIMCVCERARAARMGWWRVCVCVCVYVAAAA